MENKIIKYDTGVWRFKELMQDILRVDRLEKIHEVSHYDKLDREHDQGTLWHKRYYNRNYFFLELYERFVKEEIVKIFPYEKGIVYQKIPTFRVHLKDNIGVGEFHRDRDYNHGVNEINFHLPFTDTEESSSIWIESKEGLEDYSPCIVKYGEILIFDGANLSHGNKINSSENTRVSVDFRIIPLSKYAESGKESINTKMKFDIGGYFEKT